MITQQLRSGRKGKAGRSWYVDESYIKVDGKWCYLYRAIDREGNLVDSMLSEHRDMEATKRFFMRAKEVVGQGPARVTTDGHDAYPRAIRRILGRKVEQRTNKYLNNPLEQDHGGIKQRYYPVRGFGSFEGASRFCSAFDEQRGRQRVPFYASCPAMGIAKSTVLCCAIMSTMGRVRLEVAISNRALNLRDS